MTCGARLNSMSGSRVTTKPYQEIPYGSRVSWVLSLSTSRAICETPTRNAHTKRPPENCRVKRRALAKQAEYRRTTTIGAFNLRPEVKATMKSPKYWCVALRQPRQDTGIGIQNFAFNRRMPRLCLHVRSSTRLDINFQTIQKTPQVGIAENQQCRLTASGFVIAVFSFPATPRRARGAASVWRFRHSPGETSVAEKRFFRRFFC